MKQSKVGFWLFLLPSLLAFVLVVLVPAIWGLGYSLTDWNGVPGQKVNFVGLANYKAIFVGDSDFLHSFLFTTLFSVCSVICINVVGFALALLVTSKVKCSTLMRTVFFMPNLIGGILLGFIWKFIFKQGFEAISKITHIQGFSGWLSDTTTSFWGLLILIIWQLSGYMMIIYIAYIQSISNDLIEASQIDGANYFQRLRKIVMPLVRPAFTIGMFLSLSTCFKLYDQNLALTNGGPFNSTEMLALNIYNTAFKFNDLGLAQAKAVIFLIVVASIGLIQLSYNKKKEEL